MTETLLNLCARAFEIPRLLIVGFDFTLSAADPWRAIQMLSQSRPAIKLDSKYMYHID